jgi:hypothetical protein
MGLLEVQGDLEQTKPSHTCASGPAWFEARRCAVGRSSPMRAGLPVGLVYIYIYIYPVLDCSRFELIYLINSNSKF